MSHMKPERGPRFSRSTPPTPHSGGREFHITPPFTQFPPIFKFPLVPKNYMLSIRKIVVSSFSCLKRLLRGFYTSVTRCRVAGFLALPGRFGTIGPWCRGRVGGRALRANMGDFPFPAWVRWAHKVEYYGQGLNCGPGQIGSIGRIEGRLKFHPAQRRLLDRLEKERPPVMVGRLL